MEKTFNLLKDKVAEVADLSSASSVLHWDQQTFMPKGGAAARANSISALQKISHDMFVSDEIGKLIDKVSPWAEAKGYDSDEAGMLRALKRDYYKEKKIPSELVAEFAKEVSLAMMAWQEARAKSDFNMFSPHLEKILELSKRRAGALGYKKTPYDALLDDYEPGMTKEQVENAFTELKKGILPVYHAILQKQDRVSNKLLAAELDEDKQFKLAGEIVEALGFDFSRGRQDKSAHPFTTGFSVNDVRITTRVEKSWLPMALYASIHECGHALYALGINPAYERTTLDGGASLGVHESQSRMWENIVGRSRPFCKWLLPKLRKYFPDEFAQTDAEELYRAVNKCGPSLIRVEADEVSYNLHVLLRFEIESALLEGSIKVSDAPALWNEKMKQYVGVEPENYAQGILQDVHWSMGSIGYFPTYTLGNIMSAQFFNKAVCDIRGLHSEIEKGDFRPLLEWLRSNIHRHGRKYTATELLERTCNSKLDVKPFIEYVKGKYSEIYEL